MNDIDHFARMLENPVRAKAEFNLIDFIKQGWDVLEPGMPFVSGWAVEAIAEHLQAVTEGHIKRLVINVPPGCTKSMLTNVFWPTWEWGPRGMSNMRYISASYEQGLAVRDLVRGRDLIKSEWYQSQWPIQLKEDQDQKTYYQNTKTGWRFAASVRAALTGYRGDRIIIDDPHSVKTAESEAEREESLRWFTETVPTRLNKQGESAIVVIMQRLHERDISGLILSELADDWTYLCLPMEYEEDRHCKTTVVMPSTGLPFEDPRKDDGELLFPERFPADSVESLKRVLSSHGGSYAISGQLQQRPAPRGGGMFKRDDWQFIDAPEKGVLTIRGWDFAGTKKKKSAYTACVKMTLTVDKRLIIEDVQRVRATPGEVKRLIRAVAEADGPGVFISIPQDPGQAGIAQCHDLIQHLHGFKAFASPESGDKETRAIPLAAQVEGKNVFLVRAAWNDILMAEASLFPAGEYKDQIDAASRAYAEILKRPQRPMTHIPPTLYVNERPYDD